MEKVQRAIMCVSSAITAVAGGLFLLSDPQRVPQYIPEIDKLTYVLKYPNFYSGLIIVVASIAVMLLSATLGKSKIEVR